MKEAMLVYETDSQLGVPKLQAINGASKTWSQKDLNAMEEQLRPLYDSLVRDGKGSIRYKEKTLYIKKKDGDTSRQPTLELRSFEFCAQSTTDKPPSFSLSPVTAHVWGKGFLAEVDCLYESEPFKAILPAEKMMLDLFRAELSGLIAKTSPADLTLLMLLAILLTAEHVSRSQRPNEPRPYAYALSGIERLLSADAASPPTPWGPVPTEANPEPAPTWLERFWAKMTGG
jgi:hypothetical protein